MIVPSKRELGFDVAFIACIACMALGGLVSEEKIPT